MKALTIRQPWSQLIVAGAKNIENRDWLTYFRGRIAIHSSAQMTRAELEDACDFMKTFIPRFSTRIFSAEAQGYPKGAVLGTVDLIGCVTASDSPWFCGKYGFVLRNAVKFAQPIPCKGALGLWELPKEIEEMFVA